jgi:single-stranded-DNA-specific exonuclease
MARSKASPPLPLSATKKERLTAKALPRPTASEAAFERLVDGFDALALLPIENPARPDNRAQAEPASAAAFLEELFANQAGYLERDRFASIGDANSFYTKVVGVSFEGRQEIVAGLSAGDPLELIRDPSNPHDSNAIAVHYGKLQLGYLRREIARRLAPNIDAGDRYTANVGSVTGGGERNVGVNLHVRRRRAGGHAPAASGTQIRATLDEMRIALIGERPLRDSQHAVLERIEAGSNTIAIMGTGRGKSLCFQLPAAQRALGNGSKTLVFYPLRALTNDQHAALARRLGRFGLRIHRANGAVDGEEREALEAALEDGSWDIILATPEFATYHREVFARTCNRPALVVVDEAHHLYESRHRAAYGSLGELVASLGRPQVLALTATANEESFNEIRRALGIEAWVIDPTIRENLHVVDARNTKDKFAYLRDALDGDGKAIVYCNSRQEATKLAARLRDAFGPSVAFYHAGVPSAQRAEVEDYFRAGKIRIIVATSAFGEGIDLPNVRDVVLYHLNFNFTEFNQQAGRAGRDGIGARIHLLYGESDRKINDYIIARGSPSLPLLRELYRGMRGLSADDVLRLSHEDIARTLDLDLAEGSTVGAGVGIFAEAGLVETGTDDDGRFIRFVEVAGKIDLTQTTRFAEGEAERENFDRFCGLALGADAQTLEQIINRPIYPDRVPFLN